MSISHPCDILFPMFWIFVQMINAYRLWLYNQHYKTSQRLLSYHVLVPQQEICCFWDREQFSNVRWLLSMISAKRLFVSSARHKSKHADNDFWHVYQSLCRQKHKDWVICLSMICFMEFYMFLSPHIGMVNGWCFLK